MGVTYEQQLPVAIGQAAKPLDSKRLLEIQREADRQRVRASSAGQTQKAKEPLQHEGPHTQDLGTLDTWLKKKDLEYKSQGFSEPQRDAWREYNRKKYQQLLEQQSKAAQSENTVGAFVLGGLETAKFGNTTPATQALLRGLAQKSNPFPVDGNARSFSVPNGPYGWNYEEAATPELIPNARGVMGQEQAPPGRVTPGRLEAPKDPAQYQQWLQSLSGGST